jgi:CheY-like chemotaxis protein/HPt (histidine-containing phosphotransfer) domain-containing protein
MEISKNIICSYLADLGFSRVESAASGKEALKMMRSAAARRRPYKLCFVDMIMPVMDGWRLAAEIHNDAGINEAKLILMAPHGIMGTDTKMTLLKWFKAYINKPIKRRSLADTLNAVLGEPEEVEALGELEPPADNLSAPEKPVTKTAASGETGAVPGAEKPLVLIAEDHPINQKLFAMMLDKLGYPSILADDGQDAVEKIHAHPEAALIFMDIQMPRMNGYEATKYLRKEGFAKPIIAVTASAFADERAECLSIGIDDILIKPFKRPDIESMLTKWINGRGAAGGAEAPAVQAESFDMIPVEGPDLIKPSRNRADIISTGEEPAAAKSGKEAPSPKGAASEIFSPAELLDTFMGNDEMAYSLLYRFTARTAGQVEGIPALQKAEDWETARREAHTIKGASYTMSGKELGKAAARLEAAFKNLDFAEMEGSYPPLVEAFGRFKEEAEAFLKSKNFTPVPETTSGGGAAGEDTPARL